MKIGVCPVLNRKGGGIYLYSLRVLSELEKCKNNGEDEFVVFADELLHPALNSLRKSGWDVTLASKRFLSKLSNIFDGESMEARSLRAKRFSLRV